MSLHSRKGRHESKNPVYQCSSSTMLGARKRTQNAMRRVWLSQHGVSGSLFPKKMAFNWDGRAGCLPLGHRRSIWFRTPGERAEVGELTPQHLFSCRRTARGSGSLAILLPHSNVSQVSKTSFMILSITLTAQLHWSSNNQAVNRPFWKSVRILFVVLKASLHSGGTG